MDGIDMKSSMKVLCSFLLLIILIGCQGPDRADEDELMIREVRQKSNEAIAAHDTTSIGQTLTADYHVVTSRNATSSGRKAMLDRFAKDAPDVVYIRTPEAISVFPEWKMAGEHGTWVGRWTDGIDKIELTGSYYAKWHRVDDKWLIRAEIFVPLNCSGGKFCEKGPI